MKPRLFEAKAVFCAECLDWEPAEIVERGACTTPGCVREGLLLGALQAPLRVVLERIILAKVADKRDAQRLDIDLVAEAMELVRRFAEGERSPGLTAAAKSLEERASGRNDRGA